MIGAGTPMMAAAISPRPVLGESPRTGGGPRPLLIIGTVLVIITLVSAAAAALTVAKRVSELDTMVNRTEPLATAAENLYASLSEADAAAASAFLAGGLETNAARDTYDTAIATAANAQATTASGATSDPADQRAIAALATQLPIYTGLVDTARANNRLGLPVGAAYLREASSLMRTTLLPAAQTLYQSQSAAVVATENTAAAIPFWIAGLVGLVLVSLVIGQVLVARATRRRLNVGVLVALGATLGWFIWMSAAGVAATHQLATSRDQGATPLRAFVQARIAAQQGRADETLYLVARGSGDPDEAAFKTHSSTLTTLLASPAATGDTGSAAAAQANRWITTHQAMIDAAQSGDYSGAVTIGTGQSAADFTALDASLQTAISNVRGTLRTDADQAKSSLSGLVTGIVALAALAAIAVAAGLWPRVKEFQ